MDQEILNSYSRLNDLNVSRETFLDFENYISLIMEKNKIFTLVVMKKNKNVGVISMHDLIQARIL